MVEIICFGVLVYIIINTWEKLMGGYYVQSKDKRC